MSFTGSPMKGFFYVESAGLETDTALAVWVQRGAAFTRSLHIKYPFSAPTPFADFRVIY